MDRHGAQYYNNQLIRTPPRISALRALLPLLFAMLTGGSLHAAEAGSRLQQLFVAEPYLELYEGRDAAMPSRR